MVGRCVGSSERREEGGRRSDRTRQGPEFSRSEEEEQL